MNARAADFDASTPANAKAADDLLLEVSDALTLEPDFERFFARAAEAARVFVGADGAALILDVGGNELEYQFFNGTLSQLHDFAGYRFRKEMGSAGQALRFRRTLFTPDYASDPRAIPEFVAAGLRANIVIPLVDGENIPGALALSWFRTFETRPETDALRLAETVAAQIATACRKRLSKTRLRRSAR